MQLTTRLARHLLEYCVEKQRVLMALGPALSYCLNGSPGVYRPAGPRCIS